MTNVNETSDGKAPVRRYMLMSRQFVFSYVMNLLSVYPCYFALCNYWVIGSPS